MEIPQVDVDELERRIATGAPLLDVREDDEFAEARIAGAVHIPLAEVPLRAGEIPDGSPLYVICARGGRSASAVEWLRHKGVDAVNVAGGMIDWIDRGKQATLGSR